MLLCPDLQETGSSPLMLTETLCTALVTDQLEAVPTSQTANDASTAADAGSDGRQTQRELLARYHWLGGRLADLQVSRCMPCAPSHSVREAESTTVGAGRLTYTCWLC